MSKKYHKNNPKTKEKWEKNNPEKVKKYRKLWVEKNLEKAKEICRQWQKNNPEKIKENRRIYMNKEYKTNPKFKLDKKIKSVIRNSLKNDCKGRYWEKLLGYTLNNLIRRLKSTIPKSYSWQDYLDGKLQMDHIIPMSAFNYNKPDHIDFKRCWALNNLQLLPAKENIIKRNRISRLFQPALKI